MFLRGTACTGRSFLRVKPRGSQASRTMQAESSMTMHAARTQQRAFRRERIEIHPHIGFFRTQNRNRRSARNHSLKFVAGSNTAANFIDQFRKRNAKFALDDCGFVHMTAHTVEFGPGVLLVGSDALEPVHAAIEKCGQIGECLDVVHNRRASIQTLNRRERRLLPRLPALAFQRFDQSCFFAADISAGAGMQNDVEVVVRAENLLTEKPFCASLSIAFSRTRYP